MSNKMITAVWDKSKHKGSTLLALLSLADRSDDDGFCWPSHADTAKRARVGRSYVASKLIPDLIASGELFAHKRSGTSSQYLVLVGQSWDDISKAMARRFKYSDLRIAKNILRIYKYQYGSYPQGVQTFNTLTNERVFKLLTGMFKLLTGGVYTSEHEPSITQKETKDSSATADHSNCDFFSGVGVGERRNGNGSKPSAKKKSQYALRMERLEYAFAKARSGGRILPDWDNDPKASNKRWRTPLKRMWKKAGEDTGLTEKLVIKATKQLIDAGMTFDAPDQIEKTFGSLLTDAVSEKTSPRPVVKAPENDNRKPVDPDQVKELRRKVTA